MLPLLCSKIIKDLFQTKDNIKKVLRLNSERSRAWCFAGKYLYEHREKYKTALRCFNKAIKLDPDKKFPKKMKKLVLNKLKKQKIKTMEIVKKK